MTYATLIAHTEASADGEARIELASGLALQFGATLVGVAARDYVPLMTPPAGSHLAAGPAMLADLADAQDDEIRAGLDAAETLFRTVAGRLNLQVAWRASIGSPAQALAREARAADLLIVGRLPERGAPSRHPDPGDVLMQAGRPVLVAPPGLSRIEAMRVVVAWKDGREARRAVADALPLLRRASSVLVVEMCRPAEGREDSAAAVEDVAWHLVRHGVNATAEVQDLRGGTAAEALALIAEQHGADLIVAGGYGHSRLREWVFGGITRSLLRHCPTCCLLSH